LLSSGPGRAATGINVTASDYLFGNPTLSSDQRLNMNIFGKDQMLYFRGDFNPTFATNVDQNKLQQLVPVDRSQRVLRPVGASFNNKLPFTLANGTVRDTTITDNVSWNARNFFPGLGSWNEDLSIFKYFDITERMKVRFTSDFFNVFNHPVDFQPNTTTGLVDLSRQANPPRIVQFGLRLEW
jgi:hypothetical protein